jgi:hypothetical protein
MKTKVLLVIIAMCIGIQTVFPQTDKQIAFIRNEVNLINKHARTLAKKVKTVDGISLEGTEATYFISGKGIKKISAKMYGETYKGAIELYYSGEELIFGYQKISRYDTQIGMTPPPKIVSVKESRFYFAGEKLLKFIEGKKDVKKSAQEWTDSEKEIKELATKLKVGLLALE